MPKIIIGEVVETLNEPLESGRYPAIVTRASLGIVQSGVNAGAEKLELQIRIAGKNTVRELLIFSASMEWKIFRFVKATSLADVGDELELTDKNVVGLSFDVLIVKEPKTFEGVTRDVNIIKKFLKPELTAVDAADDLVY